MPKKLPSGVEIHNGKLRIWFMFRGDRCREQLNATPSARNIKIAGERRVAICHAIRTNAFVYSEWFPESPRTKKYEPTSTKDARLSELFEHWLRFKAAEITPATIKNYRNRLSHAIERMSDMKARDLKQEHLLSLRADWLKTCVASTVNSYMRTIKEAIAFGINNDYCDDRVLRGIKELKVAPRKPTPLSMDEFTRLIGGCLNPQDKHLWTIACFTGLRHGELLALAWEDIDIKKGTITVRRNLTLEGAFKLPKTVNGERTVYLLDPALKAVKAQQALTLLLAPVTIDVHQRDHSITIKELIHFVFSPLITGTNIVRPYYFHTAMHEKWTNACRRARITYRVPYQTRHTFACWMLSSGANPTYLANQMGHSSAKEIYHTYGDWVSDHTQEQVRMLNSAFCDKSVPNMPLKAESND